MHMYMDAVMKEVKMGMGRMKARFLDFYADGLILLVSRKKA